MGLRVGPAYVPPCAPSCCHAGARAPTGRDFSRTRRRDGAWEAAEWTRGAGQRPRWVARVAKPAGRAAATAPEDAAPRRAAISPSAVKSIDDSSDGRKDAGRSRSRMPWRSTSNQGPARAGTGPRTPRPPSRDESLTSSASPPPDPPPFRAPRRELSEDAAAAAQMLVDVLGMSKTEAEDVLQRSDDNVLSHGWVYNSEEVLGPLLRTLFDLGLTPDEVRRMILAQPTLIRRKPDLVPSKVAVLSSLGVPSSRMGRVLVKCPQLLNLSTDTVTQAAEWMRVQAGMTPSQVQRVVTAMPRALTYSIPDNLEAKRMLLTQLGWSKDDVTRTLARFPQIMGLSPLNIVGQVLHLQRWGLRPDEAATMLKEYPCLFGYRRCVLDVKAVVLRSMLGLPFTSALRFPTYFGYATDKRVLPRVAFSNHIVGKGPIDVDPAWEALAWPPPATDAAVARLTDMLTRATTAPGAYLPTLAPSTPLRPIANDEDDDDDNDDAWSCLLDPYHLSPSPSPSPSPSHARPPSPQPQTMPTQLPLPLPPHAFTHNPSRPPPLSTPHTRSRTPTSRVVMDAPMGRGWAAQGGLQSRGRGAEGAGEGLGAYAGLPDALVVRAQGVRRPGGVEEVPFGETGLDFGSFGTWLTPPDDVFLERLSKTTVQPVSRQAFWQFREAWVARNGPVLRWWQREWDRADAGE